MTTVPAIMRDTTKLVALGHATPAFSKAQIQIYSPAGEGLLLFSVDTFQEHLLDTELIVHGSGIRARLFGLAGQLTNG